MNSASSAKFVRFEQIVREHQSGLRAYVRALGAHDAWVDDLAQEVFLVAYRRFDHFDSSADLGRWLRGIARNLVMNELRKHARRSRLLHESLAGALAEAEDTTPFARSSAARVIQVMTDCVSQLPPLSRELLQRRYAESLAASALARALNLSAAAVRQTLLRTRAAVRRCMAVKLQEAPL